MRFTIPRKNDSELLLYIWKIIDLPKISMNELLYKISFELFLLSPEEALEFLQRSIKSKILERDDNNNLQLPQNSYKKLKTWQLKRKEIILSKLNSSKKFKSLIDDLESEKSSDFTTLLKAFLDKNTINRAATISDDAFKINIFDFLIHNKSILEYLAHEIAEFSNKKTKRIYFPVADKNTTQLKFEKYVIKKFPGLKNTKPKIYNYLVSIQYFNNNNWLSEFNELTNYFKHVDLVPHSTSGYASIYFHFKGAGKRVGEKGLKSIYIKKGAELELVSSDGEKRSIRGPQIIDVNTTSFDHADPDIEIERDEWTDFKFENSDSSAIGLLEIIKLNVYRIYTNLKKMLDNSN